MANIDDFNSSDSTSSTSGRNSSTGADNACARIVGDTQNHQFGNPLYDSYNYDNDDHNNNDSLTNNYTTNVITNCLSNDNMTNNNDNNSCDKSADNCHNSVNNELMIKLSESHANVDKPVDYINIVKNTTISMDTTSIETIGATTVIRPVPRERTTISRTSKSNNNNINKSGYKNVSVNCDLVNQQTCDNNNTIQTSTAMSNSVPTSWSYQRPSVDREDSNELTYLINYLESISEQMSSDSFYAIPKVPSLSSTPVTSQYSCSPPPTLPPKAKPRRSLRSKQTSSTTSTSSSLATSPRPLPEPPKYVPPPKPPHLPPETPPPPPPDSPDNQSLTSYSSTQASSSPTTTPSPPVMPEVPPRMTTREKVLRDNVDMEDKIVVNPLRKLSEPYTTTQKLPIVDPHYCQHKDCRHKGIARSQTFRSADKYSSSNKLSASRLENASPLSPTKTRLLNHNHNRAIIQKCGYLWKTGPNRRRFHDRWCVLHRHQQQSDEAVLAYYLDRKTTSSRGKLMLKDIAFVKLLDAIESKTKAPVINSTGDSTIFSYFEVGVNSRRGRVYLFAAKCLSDQRIWFNTICESIAWDYFTLNDAFHCGYVYMKYGISGQWIVNYVVLKERQITIVTKDLEEINGNHNSVANDTASIISDDSESHMSTDSMDLNSRHSYQIYDMRKVMSVAYASVHQMSSCGSAIEMGQPVCVAFQHRVIYLQCEYKAHTELWYQSLLKIWKKPETGCLEDQYLTNDNLPVAIEKCINFVSTYGADTPNLYIYQNHDSRVSQSLVTALHGNVWDVQIRIDDYSVHDVCLTVILFLKSLNECILTEKLYHNWIKANEEENPNERLQKFKVLLKILPVVNYVTLKKIVLHMVCLLQNNDKNKLTLLTLAPALSETILFFKCCNDKVIDDRTSTFDGRSAGTDIMTDLLVSYNWLFDITQQEMEKERKIQKALQLMKDAKHEVSALKVHNKPVSECQDFLIACYVYNRKYGQCVTVRVTPTMTAGDLIEYVVKKENLRDNITKLSVFEVVYEEQLERCLHNNDIVLGVTLSWVKWDQHYSHDNYLCIRENQLYEQIVRQMSDQTPITIFCSLKFADSPTKSYRKCLVEFTGAKLSVYSDQKGEKSLGKWNIEDITWYLGADGKRKHTGADKSKYAITFIDRNTPQIRSKDSPYFGRTLLCNNEEEYHKWMAGMIYAEYPNGLHNSHKTLSDQQNSRHLLD
ncbi:uncharacterized protein LOC128951295 [Oppia nitens]|uniref:uncharacterized protein LOC128951295 n=1 Tax=Oppia nitens TaxID=1686743 RepID=UPI0023DCCE49|nr:uncharacterized protein LOC128951295 [Oppia nitens]